MQRYSVDSIGVTPMSEEERLVRMLSLQERKEAVEDFLDWIDIQKATTQNIFTRRMADLERQRNQALAVMRDIIQEETRGRNE